MAILESDRVQKSDASTVETTINCNITRQQVELAALGNQNASRAIVETLQRSVISTIYRFLGKRFENEIEDIAQEVFLKFFRSLHRFDPSRGVSLETWMLSIVKHHCFDIAKEAEHQDDVARAEEGGANHSIDPDDAVEHGSFGTEFEIGHLAVSVASRFSSRDYR